MMKLYGIPNCDSVKKGSKWLESLGIDFEFYNYKKEGVPEAFLRAVIEEHTLEVVLNKRGRKWKMLNENEQAQAETLDGAVALMIEHSSLIKRPILLLDEGRSLVGFNQARWEALVQKRAVGSGKSGLE